MTLKYPHKILVVDDEASILSSLKRLFRRDKYEVLTAADGQEALEALGEVKDDVSLIISDQRMPRMTGSEFLEEAVKIAPDAIRFLLTGYADLSSVADAVNKGRIYRYITKPWNDEELRSLVRSALSQVELRWENQRLKELTDRQNEELAALNKSLEKTVQERTWALQVQNKMLKGMNSNLERSLMSIVRLLTAFVENSNPRLGEYMIETAQLAKALSMEAGLEEKEQNKIEMAALIHDIGLLGMPESLVTKDSKLMNAEEFEVYRQHPVVASLTLATVEGFKEISDIILCHHENEDGNGFPKGLHSKEIPMGARILGIAADYCTIVHLWPDSVRDLMTCARRYLDRDTLAEMDVSEPSLREEIAARMIHKGVGNRFASSTHEIFSRYFQRKHPKPEIMQVKTRSLRAGMILRQELRLKDGRLLLSKGTVLNEKCIQSIDNIGADNLSEDIIRISPPSSDTSTGTKNGP